MMPFNDPVALLLILTGAILLFFGYMIRRR